MSAQEFRDAYKMAREALAEERFDDARALVEPWCYGPQLRPSAVTHFARCHLEENNLRAAAALLAAAVEWKHEDASIRRMLGQVYLRQGRIGAGISRLTEAYHLDASKSAPLLTALEAARSINDLDLVLALSRTILADHPNDVAARLIRAEALVLNGQTLQAEADSTRLQAATNLTPALLPRIMKLFAALGRLEQARAVLDRQTDGPQKREAQLVYVESLINDDQVDRALDHLRDLEQEKADRRTGRLRLKAESHANWRANSAAALKEFGVLAGQELPAHTLRRALAVVRDTSQDLVRRERNLRLAHRLTSDQQDYESWRKTAIKGLIKSARIDDWWRAGCPRAEEITEVIAPVTSANSLYSAASRGGAIVVNNHAGPTIASVWWLQNTFETFHTVGTPSGAPYRTGDHPLELDARSGTSIRFMRLLLARLSEGAVLGITPQMGEAVAEHERVEVHCFGQTVYLSNFAARLAHGANVPIFWVQPRWCGGPSVAIDVAAMVKPTVGEVRSDYVHRWAAEFTKRSERFFRLGPENVSPNNQLWSALKSTDDRPDVDITAREASPTGVEDAEALDALLSSDD